MAPDDGQYHGVLDALGEVTTEVRQHKERVLATITLLSSELVRLQKIFDQFVAERKIEREDDMKGRDAQRLRADRFRWATLAAIGLLVLVNLLVLVFLVGRLGAR